MINTIPFAASLLLSYVPAGCAVPGGLPEHAAPAAVASPADVVASHLSGSWRTGGEDDLAYHVVPIEMEGGGRALYVEVTHASVLDELGRQEIWQLLDSSEGLRLRRYGMRSPQLGQIKYGALWPVGDLLPAVGVEELYPIADLEVSGAGEEGFEAATTHRFPIASADAIELTSTIEVSSGSLTSEQTTYDATGAEVESRSWTMEAYEPDVSVDQRDDGLVIVTLEAGEGEPAEVGDDVAVHYTGWNTSYQVFDSSYRRGEPYRLTLPGRVIEGWQEALEGTRAGAVKRVIIPSELGYGDTRRSPLIPPGETLHFIMECVEVFPSGEQ